MDFSIWGTETVGEVEEKAGESADGEEEVDHEGGDGGALGVAVDGREDHFEGEEGSGGEEVYEEGGFGEGFLNAF